MDPWYFRNIHSEKPVKCFEIKEFNIPNYICKIKQQQQVALYNLWPDGIVVPGSPRVYYNSRKNKKNLKRDTGLRMIEENSEVFPHNPMDPLFYCCNKQIDHTINYHEIDIVTDRLNLRNIFYSLGETYHQSSPYRIDIKRVGNCIVFFPVHEKTSEYPNAE